ALALLLLLLLALGCARAGEFCHGWAGGARRWHRGFQCPERWDSPAATLCCGSCSLRFCCASPAARLEQGHCPGERPPSAEPPAPVPGYLPFLLVGSVFVAFVVGGACVGICCCKCFKPQEEEQPSGLGPGQMWLLEADVPSPLSSCGTRSSVGRGPPSSSGCVAPAPSPPVPGVADAARFLPTPPGTGQLPHPSRGHHRIPADHTALGAPLFPKRTPHGHRAAAVPLRVAQGDAVLLPALHV
ncbi:SHSA1 protein, partial [Dasyornis broadbenti]|nr:SHSA1 protein [Dasyornis broadbenti]